MDESLCGPNNSELRTKSFELRPMLLRRFLIITPAVITLVLLLSYFWVPTYEEQTKGNPERLIQFITASNGDAAILNPILSADSTSSQIESLVFEGLIDRDENLQFRGRVAESWRISEHAYFHVNADTPTRLWGFIDGPTLTRKLQDEFKKAGAAWSHIEAVELLPAQTISRQIEFNANGQTRAVTIKAQAPQQVRILLTRVDQKLFDKLGAILGRAYFQGFDPLAYIQGLPDLPDDFLTAAAAEMLPATAHNPIIDFYLRKGVKFHDGHELTAEDVKFTYEAIVNPANLSPRTPDYEPVKQVEVINPYRLRIIYKHLYSPALGTWAMGILPAHLLNAAALAREAEASGHDPLKFTPRQSKFNRRPIGCGPFKFEAWKSDQYIRLKRFDNYWEGPANYRQYVMRIIPDMLTQEMEFYAGTVDNYDVLPHQVERLKVDGRFQSFSGPMFGYSYIGYNMRRPPFDDPRVRRALGMAIDTQKIIKYVLYGQGEPITGPFAKQTDYYNHAIAPLPYDPQGALNLLAEAGWQRGDEGYLQKNGKRMAFTLITNNGNPLRKDILAIAQDAWRKIGIQVETDLLEWSVFINKRVNELDFDALVLGWSIGIQPDLYQIWHSSQSGKFQLNFVGFQDEEADDLILKIRREYDHGQQVAYCRRLHDIIARTQPYTFLYVARWTALLDRRIVRQVEMSEGKPQYEPIVPTRTGGYTFHFNQWIKLSRPPVFAARN